MKKPTMYLPAVVALLVLMTHNAWADFNVPDGGSTSVLALIAIAGLAAIRRKLG